MINSEKNTVSILAVGGCGINLLKKLETTDEMANITRCFIDTSMSNLRNAKVDESEIFIFDGLDGSGKARTENHEVIGKQAKHILAKFPPAKFNILISSASGGSGGVLANTLASYIQSEDHSVVVILVGSTASEIEIQNTMKTLMSYDAIAHRNKAPIVMHYLENSKESPRAVIDDAAVAAIKALLVLFSGQNDELDTADLRHWLDHKDLNKELVSLHFCMSEAGYCEAGAVVTVATLAHHGQDTLLKPIPSYQAVGFVTRSEEDSFVGDSPLHYAISSDLVGVTHKRLSTTLKEVKDQLATAVNREKLYSKDTEITEHGLIL